MFSKSTPSIFTLSWDIQGCTLGKSGSGGIGNDVIVVDGGVTDRSSFKPVLALRQPSCISCHAKISGDLITDFNATNKPYSARTAVDELIQADSFRYDGLNPMNLNGSLIVPNIKISSGIYASRLGSSNLSLKEALTTPLNYTGSVIKPQNQTNLQSIKVVGEQRDKSKAGVNKIIEVPSVSINPPTSQEIMALGNLPGIKTLLPTNGSIASYGLTGTSKLEGFSFVNGANGEPVLKNDSSSAVCEGDILVTGSIVLSELSDLKVNDGCRFYVAKSAFFKGKVVLSGSSKRNLQIAAGNSVAMGFKHARALTGDAKNDIANALPFLEDAGYAISIVRDSASQQVVAHSYYPSCVAMQSQSYWNYVVADRPWNCAGEGVAPAAGQCYIVRAAQAPGFQASSRKSVDYERLLLVSSDVGSRYYGKYKGIIIADMALFALAHFNFEAESIFESVPILPRLGKSVLIIK